MTDPGIPGQRDQAAEPGPSAALRRQRRQTMGGSYETLVSRPAPARTGQARGTGSGERAELERRHRELERLALGG